MSVSPYLFSGERAARLRVALLLTSDSLQSAERRMLGDLQAAKHVSTLTIVVVRQRCAVPTVPFLRRTLIQVYRTLDGWLSVRDAGDPDPASTAQSISDLAPGARLLVHTDEVVPQTFVQEQHDVILAVEPFPGMQRYARAARCGLWWVGPTSSDDNTDNYLSYLLSTISATGPITELLWCRTAEEAVALPLVRGSARFASGISVTLNSEALGPLRHNLSLAALRLLSLNGWDTLRRASSAAAVYQGSTVIDAAEQPRPGLAALGGGIIRMGVRQVRHRLRLRREKEQYSVGVRILRTEPSALADLNGYHWLTAPEGYWRADPFVVTANGRDFLFMEEMVEAKRRARIVCGEVDSQGRVGAIEPVLERAHHLSYPYVFAHRGEIFMIPESGQINRVELYRARSFPTTWELVRVLYEGPAVDTSVYYDGENFWFFTSFVEDRAQLAAQLLLFRSEHVDGEWIMHPANPVSCDARIARGAGSIFRFGSRLLRPAQDCSRTYGGSMSFRAIETLTDGRYEESEFLSLSLEEVSEMIGPHTYNRTHAIEVIDGRSIVALRR